MSPVTMCVADPGGSTAPTDGGLINPAMLPARSADLDTSLITGAADGLRTMGSAVDTQTDDIALTWAGLTGCYRAPEQAEVYALMDDPAKSSEVVKTTFSKAAGYLDTYAAALEKLKTTLADFEQRAQEFRDEVVDGVWVDATEAADAGIGTYLEAGWNWATGQDQERKKVPWDQDTETWEKNKAFVEEIGGIYAQVSAAAATCATALNGLTSLPPDKKKVAGIPKEAFYNPEAPMPWGAPGDEDRNCAESVGHGVYQFGKNTVEGLGQLISYNPETGEWGDWERAGQAWMGTGNVLMSLVVSTSPIAQWLNAGLKLTGQGDSAVSKWIDERNHVSATVVTGLVGIDLDAEDPFHKWKEDGVATFTESFLNVGTMFIPGAGEVGAAVKVAGMGSKVLKIGGTIADFAVPGGSWLAKGGAHAVPVLKNLLKFGDHAPIDLLGDVTKAGAKAPGVNPLALADDVAGAKPASRPVTNSMFPDAGETGSPVRPHGTEPAGATTAPHTEPTASSDPAARHVDAATQHDAPSGHGDPHDAAADATPSAEAAHPRPDGFPAQNPHGRDYSFDADGRAHLDGDPPDSYRDRNGRLHDDRTGTFIKDPQHPAAADLPVEHAEKGTSVDEQVSPAERAAHDARVEARDRAVEGAHAASDRLARMLEPTGIDPGELRGSTRTVAHTIGQWVDEGRLTVKQGQSLRNALVNDRISANMLRSISERLGDKAAAAVAKLRGETTLIGSGGAGAGRFDQATIHGNPPTLKFYEAKGGTSQLGERTVDGVRAQQGSTSYVNDIMRTDPRLGTELRKFIDANPDSPITAALRSGTIRIEYDLVQALPGGRIKVTPFVLDPAALKRPTFQ